MGDLSRRDRETTELSAAQDASGDSEPVIQKTADTPVPRSPSDGTFEVAYSSTASFVRRVVGRLIAQPSDIDDVVQEVFLVAYRKWPRRDGEQSLHGWLHGIAVRVCWNHGRARKRWDRRHDRLAGEDDPERLEAERAPDTSLEKREILDWLVHAIGRLDEKKRQALVLTQLEERSATDVARMTGLSPNTIASRLRAALRDLKQAATDEAIMPLDSAITAQRKRRRAT